MNLTWIETLTLLPINFITFGKLLKLFILCFSIWKCYGPNVCIPSKIHMLKFLPSMILGGRAFGKYIGHEGEVLMGGTSDFTRRDVEELALQEGTWKSLLLLSALHLGGTREASHLQTRNSVLSRNQFVQHLDLGFPASRSVEMSLLFEPTILW